MAAPWARSAAWWRVRLPVSDRRADSKFATTNCRQCIGRSIPCNSRGSAARSAAAHKPVSSVMPPPQRRPASQTTTASTETTCSRTSWHSSYPLADAKARTALQSHHNHGALIRRRRRQRSRPLARRRSRICRQLCSGPKKIGQSNLRIWAWHAMRARAFQLTTSRTAPCLGSMSQSTTWRSSGKFPIQDATFPPMRQAAVARGGYDALMPKDPFDWSRQFRLPFRGTCTTAPTGVHVPAS